MLENIDLIHDLVAYFGPQKSTSMTGSGGLFQ